MKNTKVLEVAGKRYTLTANRKIITTIASICPELLKFSDKKGKQKMNESEEANIGLKILGNLDVLFYDMIKIAHPEITKERSDEILDLADEEYNNFQDSLINLATSAFESSTPNTSKKNLNW